MVYTGIGLKYDDKNKQVKQRFEKSPKKSNQGVFVS